MKKSLIIFIALAVLIGGLVIFSGGSGSDISALKNYEGEVVIHKSLSCGCCSVWSTYFGSKSGLDYEVKDYVDLIEIKSSLGIPRELESCHTSTMGDYFIEGHIPVEAINKLVEEQPDIAGIAMPGMPSGSPGMPGQKYGDFVIYQVYSNGSYSEFMRI